MRDALVMGGLLVSFATLVTLHVAIGARLVRRVRPWYRGLIAVVVPPLAPIWAYEQGWRRMTLSWVGAICLYALTLALAAT
ncbi:MAG: hypothetical protein HY908_00265 [Myxococcales bacterium]|nr:hypothetical protein [Myxococcales bacterium]MCC6521688.1 hypothetical protein [Polyangiaceae bacterium]